MNTAEISPSPSSTGTTAGQMLRAAREAKGLHLAMLAVRLKVGVRQLEALEADQYDVLKGAAFVRALAQTVSRHLGIDPGPILAALPQSNQHPQIEPLAISGERSTAKHALRNTGGRGLSRQVLALGVLMLLGAAVLIWWPSRAGDDSQEGQDPAQAAVPMGQASDVQEEPAQVASAALSASIPEPASLSASASVAIQSGSNVVAANVTGAQPPLPVSAPVRAPVAAASSAIASSTPVSATTSSATPAPSLVIRMQANAWIEVRDKQGQTPIKRMVNAGETLQLALMAPLFVYVGKADGVELSWQGKPVDLKPYTLNNEARLQIKP